MQYIMAENEMIEEKKKASCEFFSVPVDVGFTTRKMHDNSVGKWRAHFPHQTFRPTKSLCRLLVKECRYKVPASLQEHFDNHTGKNIVGTMKRIVCAIFLFVGLSLVAVAQEPQPLLSPAQMPNPVRFLPPPPDTLSAAFAYDQAQYRWGKEQRRDSVRCAQAVVDADWTIENVCRLFSVPFGMTISKEATPAIYRMLYVGLISADAVGKLPKNHYRRTRPYVYYGEPTIYPPDEEELRHNGSYPSGHTIEGWSAALLLTELNPDSADALLALGYRYGESRVIAGYHWQSDVDAGRLAASAALARLHADRRFMRLLKKAHREYHCLAARARR